MNSFPKIKTAIPQRRYRYGDYLVTVLGEIESGDDRDYRFVTAFVKDGETQPQLYVVSERLPSGDSTSGSHALRLINSSMDEVMDVGNRWQHLSDYVDQALKLGSQLLGLEQEVPYQLA
jgi:hypothetical protein